jgi:hypothetical protein
VIKTRSGVADALKRRKDHRVRAAKDVDRGKAIKVVSEGRVKAKRLLFLPRNNAA